LEGCILREIMDRKPTLERGSSVETIFENAARAMEQQGIILFPTDTIWGIGCDATQELALHKIYQLKKRPLNKPFILLVADQDMATEYVGQIHPKLDRLLHYHDRPLTVVYPFCRNLPELARGADGSVAIRIVKDEFCKGLIARLGKPIVGTSANMSDEPFPTHFGEISSAVISGVDYVTPFKQDDLQTGEPSVMVKLSEKDELVFLRN